MKTKEIPAVVMLIAGGVYCLLGIFCKIPLMDFLVQLLVVLLVFWILGGIVRMVLDHFIGEIEEEAQEEEEEAEEKDAEEESEESENDDEEDEGSVEEK